MSPPTHQPGAADQDQALRGQLRWFVMLRWWPGAAMGIGGLAYVAVSGWGTGPLALLALGGAVLAYNGVLWSLLRRRGRRPGELSVMAWAQLLLDLACLTVLVAGSGGAASPLLGFFVFHMVFASLLLPRPQAYAAAALALLLVCGVLEATGQWPTTPAARLGLLGWAITLAGTVFVANHITLRLRQHRQRLLVKNRRMRRLSRQLRRQQRALIQHEKMAAMGQMAAGVAHEIANPLANIDSMLQLIRRRPERVSLQRLAALAEQTERIGQIIQHMIDFAHPTPLQWEVMPLSEVVDLGLRMLRFDRRHKHVEIERDLAPGGCRVRVQPHAMQQVLINVLLNAIDAVADADQPRITVRTSCSEEICRVDVIDNGPGIAPEHRDRLFEPFFTTKPVGKGTGLGLAISYSLMRNQGGRIEVDSTPGVGTRMRIVLLRAAQSCDADPAAAVGAPGRDACAGPTEPDAPVRGPAGGTPAAGDSRR